MISEIEVVCAEDWMAPRLAAIEAACFSHPWSLSALEDEFACPDAWIVCALLNEEIVAYGSMRVVLDEGSIGNIACLPQFRGFGAGGKILDTLIDRAKGNGLSRIFLEVRPSNAPAVGLYRSRGFQELGRRKGFYRDPAEDALLMSLIIGLEA